MQNETKRFHRLMAEIRTPKPSGRRYNPLVQVFTEELQRFWKVLRGVSKSSDRIGNDVNDTERAENLEETPEIMKISRQNFRKTRKMAEKL